MANKLVTQDRLKALFIYDAETGVFTRRIATGRHNRHGIGTIAGTKTNKGYVVIYFDGVRMVAQKLAWLYVYGVLPTFDLDHINQVKDDNRIVNLREATRSQNMQNVTIHKHNSSGQKGVAKLRSKWRAYINVNYKQISLGIFNTKEEAIVARKAAEAVYFTHGVKA
jgi:hypothetical protein